MLTAEHRKPNSERARLHSTFDVGRSAFDVFLLIKGRVAESGLRHSTRNRASRYNGTVGSNPTPSASSPHIAFLNASQSSGSSPSRTRRNSIWYKSSGRRLH